MASKFGYKKMIFNIDEKNAKWLSKQANMSRFMNVLIEQAKRENKKLKVCPRCNGEGQV